MNHGEMQDIIDQIDASRCWKYPLEFLLWVEPGPMGNVPYLRVHVKGECNETEKPWVWNGRKWRLSWHMTRSEVVGTAFKAVLTAIEHEVRELFTYKDQAIYDGHMDVDWLASQRRTYGKTILDKRKELD